MKIIIECDTVDEVEAADGIRTFLETEMYAADLAMGHPWLVLVDAPVE